MSDVSGAVALVGSGEYTDAMLETDRWLIETLGGAGATRVVLLPTASGLESNGPSNWNALGQAHFRKLGVNVIRPSGIIDRQTAQDTDQLAALRDANFFYFSGGNPNHVVASLAGTPAWDIIREAQAHGAVMAGCSAGAMAMSGKTIAIRMAWGEGPLTLIDALAIVPQVIVFPHFDRMIGRLGRAALRTRLVSIPPDLTPIGVDEDTALVRIAGTAPGQAQWRVMGSQTVTIFWHGRDPQILHVGDEILF